MTFGGGIMILLSMIGLFLLKRKTIMENTWYLKIMLGAISLPFIANTAGWIMTEIGRQPWTVMGLFTTAQSVSPNVTAADLWISIIAFLGAYTILAVVLITLIVKQVKKGPQKDTPEKPDVDLFNKEAFGQ